MEGKGSAVGRIHSTSVQKCIFAEAYCRVDDRIRYDILLGIARLR
jgi:hypothetical protein